jgi:hypothetical protein
VETVELECEQTQTLETELSKVIAPPAMHRTEPLEQLYEQLERAHQLHTLGAIRSRCIANLVGPPEVLPESSVAHWVNEYEVLLQTAEQSRAQWEELSGLQIPSQPSDTESLQMLIDAMHSHLQASEALLSSQAKIDEESNRLDRLLLEWLKANPTCPTCGTGLTMEMMRRQHFHAGASD